MLALPYPLCQACFFGRQHPRGAGLHEIHHPLLFFCPSTSLFESLTHITPIHVGTSPQNTLRVGQGHPQTSEEQGEHLGLRMSGESTLLLASAFPESSHSVRLPHKAGFLLVSLLRLFTCLGPLSSPWARFGAGSTGRSWNSLHLLPAHVHGNKPWMLFLSVQFAVYF